MLDGVYDAFLARLVEAARAVKIGPAERPGDRWSARSSTPRPASASIDYRQIATQEGRVVLDADVGALADDGYLRRPAHLRRRRAPGADRPGGDLRPGAGRPQGAATSTRPCGSPTERRYALTGGLYSRSPAHIDRVKREFLVGNLYINRGITGALVDRQPFGGFKLSGIGTKAGGPDYLLQFLLPRTITENTMRRGFAPEDLGELNATKGQGKDD